MTHLFRSSDMKGIAYMCAGVFSLTISDMIAKWFGNHYAPIQLTFLRGLISVFTIVLLVILWEKQHMLRSKYWGWHLGRGTIGLLAACSYYLGLSLMPFADVTAIGYSSPLFVALLSALFFKEKVRLKAWAAILLGFVGVLVFARPGTSGIQLAAIFPLLTALGYATMLVMSKQIDASDNMITIMFYLALSQLVFSAPIIPWYWHSVMPIHWLGFIAMAFLSSLGLGMLTQAFRIAPASVVAPYDYTAIVWAVGIGWLVWHEVPDMWTICGIALITLSGVYVIIERARRT